MSQVTAPSLAAAPAMWLRSHFNVQHVARNTSIKGMLPFPTSWKRLSFALYVKSVGCGALGHYLFTRSLETIRHDFIPKVLGSNNLMGLLGLQNCGVLEEAKWGKKPSHIPS